MVYLEVYVKVAVRKGQVYMEKTEWFINGEVFMPKIIDVYKLNKSFELRING